MKIDYSKLYTLRSDGRYQGYYRDANNIRHVVCDKDPEKLYAKINAKEHPETPVVTFAMIAEDGAGTQGKQLQVAHGATTSRIIKTLLQNMVAVL